MLPFCERCCCGNLGILGVFLLRAGCLSTTGSFPARGSLCAPLPLELPLSDPDRDEEEVLLLADDDDEEEDEDDKDAEVADADPPFKT